MTWYPTASLATPFADAELRLFLDGLGEVYRAIHGDRIATDDDLFIDDDDSNWGFLWNQLEGSQRFVVLSELAHALTDQQPPPTVFTCYHVSGLWMMSQSMNESVSCEIDDTNETIIRRQITHALKTTGCDFFEDLSAKSDDHEQFHNALAWLFFERLTDGIKWVNQLPKLPSQSETQLARKYLNCAIRLGDLPEKQAFFRELGWRISKAVSWDYLADTSGDLSPQLIFHCLENRLTVVPSDGVEICVVHDSRFDIGAIAEAFDDAPRMTSCMGELLFAGRFEGNDCEVLIWPSTPEIFRDEGSVF